MSESQPSIPTLIDRYEVVRLLGAGGMGAVYEARHKGTGRRVAVKLIKEEAAEGPGVVERFQREARAAGAIDSEHITQVLDSGTDPASGAPFLVMELLAGEDLHTVAKRLRPIRPELALRIVAQALMGLERAHAAHVIHRDIKPPNLFLARKENGEYVVKLCDFGIAKVGSDVLTSSQNAVLTHTSALLGSPVYMSPEQAKGAKTTDARTDLWSMGVVLYELLVGGTPYPDADTLGLILLAICSDPPAAVQEHAPWVPAEIAAVVKRAMTTPLSLRFQTAREMLDAVMALLPGGTAIDESMLTPMTDDERAQMAPKPVVEDVAPLAATVAETSARMSLGVRSTPRPSGEAPTTEPNASDEKKEAIAASAVSASSAVDPRTATAGAYARASEHLPARSRARGPFLAAAMFGGLLAGGVVVYAMWNNAVKPAPAGLAPVGATQGPVVAATPAARVPAASSSATPDAPAPFPSPSTSASTSPSTAAPATPSASAHATSPAPGKPPAPRPSARPGAPAAPPKSPSSPSPAASSTSSPISRDFN